MPLCEISMPTALSDEKHKQLIYKASKIIAEATGKTEEYIMVTISQKGFLMGGLEDPAAVIDIKSIGGLTNTACRVISQQFCEYLNSDFDVFPDRVYITMAEVPASRWGWNGKTFG